MQWPWLRGNSAPEECKTASTQMSRWPCQKCQYKSTDGPSGPIKATTLYDSLPRLEVLLQDVVLGGSSIGREA
eukprot:1209939-Pyramimonas_sp.AAC.1